MSTRALNWAFTQTITPPGKKFVLVAIADHADGEGYCYPGAKRLAEMTGLEERSVRAHITALETDGLITVVERFRDDGGQARSGYWLHMPGVKIPGTPPAKNAPSPPANSVIPPPANFADRSLLEPSVEPPPTPSTNFPDEGCLEEGQKREPGSELSNLGQNPVTGSEKSGDSPPHTETHSAPGSLEAATTAVLEGRALADAAMFDAIQRGNPDASYAAFQALWNFMASPSHRANDRARWTRAVARIPYWLELPEAFVLEVVRLARGARGVFASSWGACEAWLENPAGAVQAHPDLAALLENTVPDGVTRRSGAVKFEPGEYVTARGNHVTVVDVRDGGIELHDGDFVTIGAQTVGWRRLEVVS